MLGVTSDFATGSEIQTGTWSDLMIQGNGFFCVQNPTSGAVYYTRDGSFQINSAGYLTDMHGNEVLDAAGKPIQLKPQAPTPNTPYAIDKFGNVTGTDQPAP